MVDSKFSGNVHMALSAAVLHDFKSLPSWGKRQEPGSGGGAGRRGGRTLPPSGTAAGPYRRATRRQGLIYLFS
jgi:hypothetical protein